MEVTLQAGEVLVIPPYWWHHVRTLEPSASVNMWSLTPEFVAMEEIYRKPLPFEVEWSLTSKIDALRVWIHCLLSTLSKPAADLVKTTLPVIGTESSMLLKELWRIRYQSVVEAGQLILPREEVFNMQQACASPLDQVYQRVPLGKLKQGLAHVHPTFFAMREMLAIQKVCAFNYIEHVVEMVVGASAVAPFFSACSNQFRK